MLLRRKHTWTFSAERVRHYRPFAEQAIFASIIVLGGLLAYRKQLSLLGGLVVVTFFAMFHGITLVEEGPRGVWFFIFAVDCLIAAWTVLGSANDRRTYSSD